MVSSTASISTRSSLSDVNHAAWIRSDFLQLRGTFLNLLNRGFVVGLNLHLHLPFTWSENLTIHGAHVGITEL